MSVQLACWSLLLVAMSHMGPVHSVFFFYGKNTKTNDNDSYVIMMPNIDIKKSTTKKYLRPPGLGENMTYYRNLSLRFTPDQRCKIGLPLSMAVFQFSPYTSDNLKVVPPKRMLITLKNGTRIMKLGEVQYGFKFFGFFPAILKKSIKACCHEQSDVRFAKILLKQFVPADVGAENDYDFSFPLYGDSMEATTYRSNHFIPIVQAPSVALLVLSDSGGIGKTHFIATTIIKAWPMFLFILLVAYAAGVIMWCLERFKNREEFPKPFSEGAWEGFWWAFITMTTVGYGDRTPKSFLARFFCILWIIFGIVIISVLSGLITAALSASTKIHFKLHGAKIGAVAGSEEFRFGLSLNADMKEFDSNTQAFTALHYHKTIEGILVDNYVASAFSKEFEASNIRRDRMMDHAITYGIRMAKGSEEMEKCIRKYLNDNPTEVFDTFRRSMPASQKNAKDRENVQHKEAEKLFRYDETMTNMLKYGAIFIAALLSLGIFIQALVYLYKKQSGRRSTITHKVVSDTQWDRVSFQNADRPLKELLDQYKCFQVGWAKKMKAIHEE